MEEVKALLAQLAVPQTLPVTDPLQKLAVFDVKAFDAHEAVPHTDPVAGPFKKLELIEAEAQLDETAQNDCDAQEADIA